MANEEPKKTLIIRILQVLEKYSDTDTPLTQAQIMGYLKKDFDIECERKAVARNIAVLRDMGFDIETVPDGAYLATRTFENSELRVLIDGVLCSRHINAKHSADLVKKLISMGSVSFKSNSKYVYKTDNKSKSGNKDFFLNVEILGEAIEGGKKVSFFYNKFGTDKKLHRVSDERRTVSPYSMILHNQRYYLAGNVQKYDDLTFFRVDKITDIKIEEEKTRPVKTLPDYGDGLNIGQMSTSLPYLFSDRPKEITLCCDKKIIDDLVDWFGTDFNVAEQADGQITASVRASERAMHYWLLQYGEHVEVLAPASLRDKVKETVKNMCKRYQIKGRG